MQTKLGSHINTQKGFAFQSKWYRDIGIPIVRVSDFTDDSIDTNELTYIPTELAKEYQRYRLATDDVVIQTVGSWPSNPKSVVGKAIKTPFMANGALLNQNAVRLDPLEDLDKAYLFYLLKNSDFKNYIVGCAQGAASQASITLDAIREYSFDLPSLPTQRRIADILSAYDDLIENNTRRIRILEQMAQSIYQEWFGKVDKESLPAGWEFRKMDDVADVIDCLHSKKPELLENGKGIFLQLSNIGKNGKLDLTKKYFINDADYQLWTSRIEVSSGDCVVTNVGRVAAVAQIPEGVKAALGRNMTAIRPRLITPTYLLEFLLSPNMAREVHQKKDSGVIMDALNVRGIIKLEILIPSFQRLAEFEAVVRPMRKLIEILFVKNANLRKTRDLLLPRLVSGEIDVSE